MTVWLLPTKSPVKYRGKHPTRARSVSASGHGGRHVELNNGARLWSIDENRSADWACCEFGADYAKPLARAVPMSADQYAVLLKAAEIDREAIQYCGNTRREQVYARSRPLRQSIKDSPMAVAKRGAIARGTEFSPQEGKPFRVWIHSNTASCAWTFETLQGAREYLLAQVLRAESIKSGGAPAGPATLCPYESFITGPDGFTETLADSPWRYAAPDFGVAWYRPGSIEDMRATLDNANATPLSVSPAARAHIRRDNVEYHAGKAAREAGEPLSANPYSLGERGNRWTLGWNEGESPADAAPYMITGRSVDGDMSYGSMGWQEGRVGALALSKADAETIAAELETEEATTRQPDSGIYGIKAEPFVPSLYTLAAYREEQAMSARLEAQYGHLFGE